jgi:Flp pilus assembly protein TadD
MRASHKGAVLALLGLFVLAVVVATFGVIHPKPNRAVVKVSRVGSGVHLLPNHIVFSFDPLAQRIEVPRAGGLALLEARVDYPQTDGSSVSADLLISVAGDGALPVSVKSVRDRGLDRALGDWVREIVAPSLGAQHLAGATELWQTIFPDDPALILPDLQPILDDRLPELEVRKVEIRPTADPRGIRAVARSEVARRTAGRGRLILLGLDALDWRLVDELIHKGLMPTMAELVASGVHAVLDVPPPLISPVVWTTIATGVTPDVHGVLDFLEPEPETGQAQPVGSGSRKAAAVWEMTSAAGRTTSVIGWWATFPAQAPPGCTVYSDRLTEQLLGLEANAPGVAAPPEAAEAINGLVFRGSDMTAAMLAPFARVSDFELTALRQRRESFGDLVAGLATLVAATRTVEKLTEHEIGRGTEIVLSYLEGTDTVGHLFAPHRPPAQKAVPAHEAQRFGQVVDRYYADVDGWLATVVAKMEDDDTLVIVSDHGFTWGSDRPPVAAGVHTPTAAWWHRPEGAFLVVGPKVQHTSRRQRLGVIDVAPILLALAGLPPAEEMTGTVPDWLSSAGRQTSLPGPGRVNYASLLPRQAPPKIELPQEAKDEELAKLRALGYVASDEQTPASEHTPPVIPSRPVVDRAEARRLTNQGTTLVAAGDRAQAEQIFRQAIAADPEYAPPYFNLSLMYRKDGRFDAADTEFWKAIELGVADREMAVVRLALDYRQRGDSERALRAFNEGLKRLPGSALIWLNTGVYLGELDRLVEAQRCLERSIRIDPKNPNAHANLAAALLELGDRDGARRALAEAVRLDPGNQELQIEMDRLGGPGDQ